MKQREKLEGWEARKLESDANNPGVEPRKEADRLLEELAALKAHLAEVQAEAEAKMRAVRERYDWQIENYTYHIKETEKQLKALMKLHDPELFDGCDTVRLQNGLLLRSEGYKVRIPRDALPKIEAQGWHEAIKVTKSINRDVVSKWPESRLVVIGAERRRVVNYEYEFKAQS